VKCHQSTGRVHRIVARGSSEYNAQMRLLKLFLVVLIIALITVPATPTSPEDWPVWGGPKRNFISSSTGLANSWPASGPKRIWSRGLGDGYSAIAEEAGVLYTGFHRGQDDVIVALEAKTGHTIWEYAYANPFTNSYSEAVGPGPYSMPQVVGDRVLTASGTGKIQSLDKKNGKPVWSHDLYKEFGGTQLIFGYACHPLAYKDALIYMVGGKGNSVIAFRQTDGAVVWKNLDLLNSYSSPLLINVDGQEQVVGVFGHFIVGFSPTSGSEFWRHEHKEINAGINISTPVWAPGNLLYVGTAYAVGSRVLELHQSQGRTVVKEVWANNRLKLHFGSAIYKDGHLYLSSGHSGPTFLTAIELNSGVVKWQDRQFAKAQLLAADGKIILLDEDGNLGLLRVSPEKLEVLSRASILKHLAWTIPTLVGTRLYVRDRETIAAYELGK
jgi:outer membrane protein assembly factor BamB